MIVANTNTNTNTKYTGQTRNKLLAQWVHLTNHASQRRCLEQWTDGRNLGGGGGNRPVQCGSHAYDSWSPAGICHKECHLAPLCVGYAYALLPVPPPVPATSKSSISTSPSPPSAVGTVGGTTAAIAQPGVRRLRPVGGSERPPLRHDTSQTRAQTWQARVQAARALVPVE